MNSPPRQDAPDSQIFRVHYMSYMEEFKKSQGAIPPGLSRDDDGLPESCPIELPTPLVEIVHSYLDFETAWESGDITARAKNLAYRCVLLNESVDYTGIPRGLGFRDDGDSYFRFSQGTRNYLRIYELYIRVRNSFENGYRFRRPFHQSLFNFFLWSGFYLESSFSWQEYHRQMYTTIKFDSNHGRMFMIYAYKTHPMSSDDFHIFETNSVKDGEKIIAKIPGVYRGDGSSYVSLGALISGELKRVAKLEGLSVVSGDSNILNPSYLPAGFQHDVLLQCNAVQMINIGGIDPSMLKNIKILRLKTFTKLDISSIMLLPSLVRFEALNYPHNPKCLSELFEGAKFKVRIT